MEDSIDELTEDELLKILEIDESKYYALLKRERIKFIEKTIKAVLQEQDNPDLKIIYNG